MGRDMGKLIPFGVGTMCLAIMVTFGDARSIESHHIQKKFQANPEARGENSEEHPLLIVPSPFKVKEGDMVRKYLDDSKESDDSDEPDEDEISVHISGSTMYVHVPDCEGCTATTVEVHDGKTDEMVATE